jgi:two-component system sensor histidine kinase BaeS
MLRTLRGRFVLSHVLPMLLIFPLMGITLVYVLETQVLLASLSNELTEQAGLVAEIAGGRTDIWDNPAQAQAFVTYLDSRLEARAMLLDPNGQVLASNDLSEAGRLGQALEHPDWVNVLAGMVSARTTYSRNLHREVVEVLVPVVRPDQQIAGVVRLSHRLTGVYERFLRLRYLIAGVLVGGLVLGAIVGWSLALNLERPLRQVTQAVWQLSSGERTMPLPERGPQEVRLLLRSVNTLVERLRSLEQARRQLLANLVHELGRPLGAFRSAIEALLGGADDEVTLRQELLVGMKDEADRLRRLLDDLSRLYDQVSGTLELARCPTDLREWLSHTLSPWREAAEAKGLHWQATLPIALPNLAIDPDRLGQALGNLLSNAIKFTPPDGTVSVSAGIEGEEVWIRVSDTGPGIAPEEQDRTFTPFYRGQLGRRFPQGMGLGLSIARELVVAHGGQLEMESTLGLGSHFILRLPLNPLQP